MLSGVFFYSLVLMHNQKFKLMKYSLFVLLIIFLFASCDDSEVLNPYPDSFLEVILNEIPYNTEKYVRVGYTLKTWEYEKDGLKLDRITVINDDTGAELMQLDVDELRRIYKEPITLSPLFVWNTLDSYYMSIQLPIDINTNMPSSISHSLAFRDTINNDEGVIINGGGFSPRTGEEPLVISSPVKGENLLFINQSTCLYHFDALIFLDDDIFTPERFAFDNIKLNASYTDSYDGDPTQNESYLIYGDTLYAVADGIIEHIQDGRLENSGNLLDVPLNTADEYAGNYLVLKIGSNQYAFYCHVIPESFLVQEGDFVEDGEPLALLGNSGNSTEPHLHFHIADGPDLWKSMGIPVVLREFVMIGNFEEGLFEPTTVNNIMMEQYNIVNVY